MRAKESLTVFSELGETIRHFDICSGLKAPPICTESRADRRLDHAFDGTGKFGGELFDPTCIRQ